VPPAQAPPDPGAVLRSREYARALVLAAAIGAPISALAYWFLKLVDMLQTALFEDLPGELGFSAPPAWWPIPLVAVSGLLTALAITRLPGTGGHSPADGFKPAGVTMPRELPGILLASLATLGFGAVLGPEAPLILLGGGLGALAVRVVARDAPPSAAALIGGAGSFAAISSLLGSPLLGAFLLLEAVGLGGAALGVALLPGLLAAGIGTLVFVGIDAITGFGTFSLALPALPSFDRPTVAQIAWAPVFGIVAALLARGIRLTALAVRPRVEPRMVLLMPLLGVVIGALAVLFGQATDHPATDVLFSGQTAMPEVLSEASSWSVGALLLLIACKGAAYALSLSSFRGGPVFPAIFLGMAVGMAAADLPGLELVPAVAMGIGAMSAAMLGLPLTATLLATLLLGSDGLAAMPLVIVAVVVAHVLTAHLTPVAAPEPAGAEDQARRTPTMPPTSTPTTVTR
jgi:chloride channel protein, CIC family